MATNHWLRKELLTKLKSLQHPLKSFGCFLLPENQRSFSKMISNFKFTSKLVQTCFVFHSPLKSLLSQNNLIRRKQNSKSIQSFIVQTTQSKTKIRVSKSFCLYIAFSLPAFPTQSKLYHEYIKPHFDFNNFVLLLFLLSVQS